MRGTPQKTTGRSLWLLHIRIFCVYSMCRREALSVVLGIVEGWEGGKGKSRQRHTLRSTARSLRFCRLHTREVSGSDPRNRAAPQTNHRSCAMRNQPCGQVNICTNKYVLRCCPSCIVMMSKRESLGADRKISCL